MLFDMKQTSKGRWSNGLRPFSAKPCRRHQLLSTRSLFIRGRVKGIGIVRKKDEIAVRNFSRGIPLGKVAGCGLGDQC